MKTFLTAAGIACGVLIAAGCEPRQPDPQPGEPALPAAEVPEPQTTAPGLAPGEEPLPRAFPGVQEDTAQWPGRPGPDADPGI